MADQNFVRKNMKRTTIHKGDDKSDPAVYLTTIEIMHKNLVQGIGMVKGQIIKICCSPGYWGL